MRIEARSSIHPIDAVINGLEGFLEVEVGEGGVLDLSVAPRAVSTFRSIASRRAMPSMTER